MVAIDLPKAEVKPHQTLISQFKVSMENHQLIKIFNEIAGMLEAENAPFKPAAYRRAARALAMLSESAAEIYRRGGLAALKEIDGVGDGIAKKMEEYFLTGAIGEHRELKRRLPVNLEEILAVEGLGPKKARILFEKLGVKNLADLEAAARQNRIAPLAGFGEKSQAAVLQGVEFQKRRAGRFLINKVLPRAREIKERLEKSGGLARLEIAGSLRRGKETIGDIDFLGAAKTAAAAGKAMDFFAALPEMKKIWAKGATKCSGRTEYGFDMDLRLVPPESFGAAWQYFTGSKDHNIALRRRAKEKGYKLSEYGLFDGGRMIAGAAEEGVYEKLGLPWIPPELRENAGEIEAAQAGILPEIIGVSALRGDLHCHSDWDGGENSIKEIAAAADQIGYDYVGIADHTKFLKIENGLDEKKLRERNEAIDELNRRGAPVLILKGCEANIMADGAVDIDDRALAELDFAIAGIHSNMKMDRRAMTARIIAAMENPYVDIVSHPTGRLIERRPEYDFDFDAVCAAAAATGTMLEINAFPDRLDLNDRRIRTAKERGVKMIINSDSHQIAHLRFAEFGIAQARRGWATAGDIANTLPWPELRKTLKRNRKRVN